MDALLLILFLLITFGFTAAVSRVSERPVVRPGFCSTCQYSLEGLPDHGLCPECGQSYPSDAPVLPPPIPQTPARRFMTLLPLFSMILNPAITMYFGRDDDLPAIVGAAIMGCIPLALALAATTAAAVRATTLSLSLFSVTITLLSIVPPPLLVLAQSHTGCCRPSPLSDYVAGAIASIILAMSFGALTWIGKAAARLMGLIPATDLP